MKIGGVVEFHARGWFEGVGYGSVSTAEGSNRYSVVGCDGCVVSDLILVNVCVQVMNEKKRLEESKQCQVSKARIVG